MTQSNFATAAEALAHFGVKGMHWGERKQTIKSARQAQGKHIRKLANAEQEFLRARQSGNGKKTAEAQVKLNATFKETQKNRLTAATLTRGEQAAVLILGTVTTGVGGVGFLAGNKFATREGQKIKDYPVSILRNVDPDKED